MELISQVQNSKTDCIGSNIIGQPVGCLKMSNRQAIKKAEFQALDAWGRHPRLNIKGAWDRHPRLSIQTLRPKARVSTSRRVGSTPASQHQGALARRPRLNFKARGIEPRVSASRRVWLDARISAPRRVWLDTRVSAPRRVGSTPASQLQLPGLRGQSTRM